MRDVFAVFILVPTVLSLTPTSNTPVSRRDASMPILTGCLTGAFMSADQARADSMDSALPLGRPQLIPEIESTPSWSLPSLVTNLGKSRILEMELSPLKSSLSPFAEQELYYAPFLFGSWNVTATLQCKVYPYGTNYVPSVSLIEGSPRNRIEKVGDSTSYQLHYFSTLANTASNQITVQLGLGVPSSKVIADRKFNIIATSKAYKQLNPVQDVEWNPTKDPTRLVLSFDPGAVAPDMRPLGQQKAQVYITARQSEDAFDEETGQPIYCASETSRSVTQGPGTVIVSDTESITEFRKISDSHVVSTSRIAVYLTPNPNSREGVLWQQVGGKAVAFYDYEIEMRRNEETFLVDGKEQKRACVKTPKDIIQCF